jgi:hypothetical protein
MEVADRHAVYKLGVHEICRRHGLSATFMAKWHEDRGGQSCHLHVSLADADRRNLFAAGEDELLLRFIGGLEPYAADVFMLWAPYPNSYKRLRSGSFAPASLAWGGDNRTVAFRVCGVADERRVPLIIHAGHGIPPLGRCVLDYSSEFPDSRIVLAHAGISDLSWLWRHVESHPNLFFDTSLETTWWNIGDLLALFSLVPPARILFGSDAPTERRWAPRRLRCDARSRWDFRRNSCER